MFLYSTHALENCVYSLKPTSLNFVAGKIQISDSSKQLLDQFGMYDVSCRGEIPIKVISDIAHEIFDRL